MNKISSDNLFRANQLRSSSDKTVGNGGTGKTDSKTKDFAIHSDNLKLSGRAAEVSDIASRAASMPDVRGELVARYSALVSSGSYHPKSADIASAMLSEEF